MPRGTRTPRGGDEHLSAVALDIVGHARYGSVIRVAGALRGDAIRTSGRPHLKRDRKRTRMVSLDERLQRFRPFGDFVSGQSAADAGIVRGRAVDRDALLRP